MVYTNLKTALRRRLQRLAMRQPSFDNLEKVLAARARRSKLQVGSSPGRLQEVETLMREQDAAGAQRLAARAKVDAAASALKIAIS